MGYISHIKLPNGTTYDIQDNQPAVLDIPNTPASIATFSGASNLPLSSLKVAVTPYQDLHGYDAPWVGGAGKNKFDSDTVLSTFTKNNNKYVGMPSRVVDNYVISGGFKTNTRYTLSYKAYNNTSTPSNFRFIFSYTDGTEEIIGGFVDTTTEKVIVGTSAENKTISKIRTRYGNGVELTLYDIQLEEGSTATSYAPYSNICPISGWDEAVVSVSGINVWDEEWEVGAIGYANGQNVATTDRIRSKNYIPILPNTSYYYIFPNGGAYFFYDENKTFITATQITSSKSVVSPSNAYFTRIAEHPEYGTTYKNDSGVNYPSTDTEYHAYNGQTYTIDLGGTRYGGVLDAVNGVLTVDRTMVTLDGGENWGLDRKYGSFNRFYIRNDDIKKYNDYTSRMICNECEIARGYAWYTNVVGNFAVTGYTVMQNNQNYLYVAHKTIATVEALKTYLSQHPLQVVYELATPITVQLAPTPVKSLEGVNKIFANCGQITEGKYVVSKYNGMTAKISEVAYSATNATSATTASKLGSSNVGSATRPIYLSAGTATACTYTLGKSVPSNAVFTDTQANWAQTTATALDYIKNKPTFGTALTLSGTTVNHSNYGSSGTAGTSSATHGATLAVPYVTTNAQGHVTGKGTHTHTVTGIQHTTSNTARVVLYDDGQVSVQTKGYLSCNNYANSGFKPMTASAFNVSSSRKVKENIEPIADEEAYKLLDVTPVSFDYISEIGGAKNQFGVIAEEVNDILPFVVSIPEDYKEDDGNYMNVPSVDYSKFIPHLIKLVQIQEQKINDLQKEIFELKNK